MQFRTRQDIEAPIEHVFAAVTDFDSFERRGLRRGAEIERSDPAGVPALGTTWKIRARIRGKARNIRSEVTEFDRPNGFRIHSDSGGLATDFAVQLLPLSPRRTRLEVTFEIGASSLTGRLVLQSLRLAKSALNTRFNKRVSEVALEIAEGYATGRN